MNDTSTPAAPTEGVGTFEDRVAAVNEALSDAPSQSAGDVTGAAAAPPSPADSDAAQRAAERRSRLEALKESHRQKVDARTQSAAVDKMQRDYAAAMRRAEEAEAAASIRLDPALLKDPARLMRLMGEHGVPPDQVANALRDAIQDPTIGASRAAREAITPELMAMRQQLAETQAAMRQMHEHIQAKQAAEEERQAEAHFLGMVAQSAERAPLASRLLAHDRDEFMEVATIAAAKVPGGGPDALLDAVEEILDSDVRKLAQKYASLYGHPSTPTTAPISTSRAAAQALTTVSNSAAQERASLVDEESFASLPIEERAARLIRSM